VLDLRVTETLASGHKRPASYPEGTRKSNRRVRSSGSEYIQDHRMEAELLLDHANDILGPGPDFATRVMARMMLGRHHIPDIYRRPAQLVAA